MRTTKITKKEMQKIEKICENVLGTSVNRISIYIDKRLSGNYLVLEMLNYRIEKDYGNYKPIEYETYETTDDYDLKYKIKLILINKILEKYDFDLKTKFMLQIVYDNEKSKILKIDDLFNCVDYFEENIDDIKDENKDKKYEIQLIDNKNNYKDILFKKLEIKNSRYISKLENKFTHMVLNNLYLKNKRYYIKKLNKSLEDILYHIITQYKIDEKVDNDYINVLETIINTNMDFDKAVNILNS